MSKVVGVEQRVAAVMAVVEAAAPVAEVDLPLPPQEQYNKKAPTTIHKRA